MKALFVIPSYFSGRHLPALFESLRAQVADWEAVVVDNTCRPDEAAALRQLIGRAEPIIVVHSMVNVGYYNSLAVAASCKPFEEYDQIWLVNPDVRLFDDALAKALGSPKELHVGVLAPSIVSGRGGYDQNPFLVSRPGPRWWRRLRLIFRLQVIAKLWVWGSTFKPRPEDSAASPGSIYAPHGACVIFLRSYFERGGPLERPEWLFLEEVTIAEEARARGLGVRYSPGIKVRHVGQSSTGTWRSAELLRAQRTAIESVSDRYAPW